MFTGRYPQTTGLTHKAALRIPEPYLTLPELFQRERLHAPWAWSPTPCSPRSFGWNQRLRRVRARPGAAATSRDDPRPSATCSRRRGSTSWRCPLLAASTPGAERAVRLAPLLRPARALHAAAGRRRTRSWATPCTAGATPHRAAPGATRLQARRPGRPRATTSPSTTPTSWWPTAYIGEAARPRAASSACSTTPDRLHRRPRREPGRARLLVRARAAALQHHRARAALLRPRRAGRRPAERIGRPVELVDLYPTLRDLVAAGRAGRRPRRQEPAAAARGRPAGQVARLPARPSREAGPQKPRYFRSVQEADLEAGPGVGAAAAPPAARALRALRPGRRSPGDPQPRRRAAGGGAPAARRAAAAGCKNRRRAARRAGEETEERSRRCGRWAT